MTRARAKLLEQQVNLILAQPDVCYDESFILPKSLHLCMIRFEEAHDVARVEGKQLDMEDKPKCAREEREAGASPESSDSKRYYRSLQSGTTARPKSRPTPDTPEVRRPEVDDPLKTSGTTAPSSSGTTAQAVLPPVPSGTTAH